MHYSMTYFSPHLIITNIRIYFPGLLYYSLELNLLYYPCMAKILQDGILK